MPLAEGFGEEVTNPGAPDGLAAIPVWALMEIVRAGAPIVSSEAPKLQRASEWTTAHWLEWVVSIALPSFLDSARAWSTGTNTAAATCNTMSVGVVLDRHVLEVLGARTMALLYSAGSVIWFPASQAVGSPDAHRLRQWLPFRLYQ
jgi:hypothetical protein